MYIETRFFDSGKAVARLHRAETEPQIETSDGYDGYIEQVDDLQEWIEDNMVIELDDIVGFVIDLEKGDWVDITAYC